MTDFERAFQEELQKIAGEFKEEERLVRRAGPAAGALVGGTIGGAIKGFKGKKKDIPLAVLTGVGTGATLGWVPDIALSAAEASKRYKRKKLQEKNKSAAAAMTPTMPKVKGLEQLSKGTAAAGTKGFATAMRAPLSLVTALKPPKQTFYKGI
jgi:hypothetical protein